MLVRTVMLRSSTARPTIRAVLVLALVAAACGGDDPAADPFVTSTPVTTIPETTGPMTTSPETTMSDTTMSDTMVPGTTVPKTTVAGTIGPAPTTTTEATMPADQPPVVRTAIADLVQRTGADPAAVMVAAFESVTWRDGSIGCPAPGMSYTQALVPGYRIELVADGTSHWYHGARDGEPFWCATPSDPADGGSPDT
jgi:hypothetical protein